MELALASHREGRARTLSSIMRRVASAATACAAASAATRSAELRWATRADSASAYSAGGRPVPQVPTSQSARARSSAACAFGWAPAGAAGS